MRLDAWHEHQLRTDPAYAQAVAEVEADERERVADQIVALRVRADLTQAEVAKLAGTTQAVVSRLEAAVGNPKLETVSRVLQALRTAVAEPWVGANTTFVAARVPGWDILASSAAAWRYVTTTEQVRNLSGPIVPTYAVYDRAVPAPAVAAANADYALAA